MNEIIEGLIGETWSGRRGIYLADVVDMLQSLSSEQAAVALGDMEDARAI